MRARLKLWILRKIFTPELVAHVQHARQDNRQDRPSS
jgi:hypothetical protein